MEHNGELEQDGQDKQDNCLLNSRCEFYFQLFYSKVSILSILSILF